MKKSNGGVTFSYTIPFSREEMEKNEDAKISMQQVFGGIESDLSKALKQLEATSYVTDMCFAVIDNLDVKCLHSLELGHFLYGGFELVGPGHPKPKVHPKAKQALQRGWDKFLNDLKFISGNLDYIKKPGYFLYSPDVESLNGVFYLSGGLFNYREEEIFLNPFVKDKRNYSFLQHFFKYWKY